MHVYIYIYILRSFDIYRSLTSYTQFAIQDWGLLGPNPSKFLAQIVYAFP